MGTLASAATLTPAKARNSVWAIGIILVATRVVLLAHWFTERAGWTWFRHRAERAMRWLTKPIPIDNARRENYR